MNTITVTSSVNYDVIIGRGLLNNIGELILKNLSPNHTAIITDDIVDRLYGSSLDSSLQKSGISACKFVFPHGEGSKNLHTLENILEFLAENDITRSDMIIAFGGGVVGDIAGFAAACYMRGINYIQIPTTFLAAIDSSVGGKTAVDLKAGKNLAGAFHQPRLVICDTNTLSTLPPDIFADGAAESIKYGMLSSEPLFNILKTGRFDDKLEEIIKQCVSIKASIIQNDEFDNGERQKLNLGHTLGHAIERLSEYKITHGHAVAIGMAIISRASFKLGLSDCDCLTPLLEALTACNLPISCNYSAQDLYNAALSDKKRNGGSITVVLPRHIGDCYLKTIPVNELLAYIQAGLED